MPVPKGKTARQGTSPAAAANPARGEHSITLAGQLYLLRPSAAASFAIEEELGLSLMEVFTACNGMALSYQQVGVVLKHYIQAGAKEGDALTRNVNAERLAELAYEEGAAPVFVTLAMVLMDAIGGGRTASGEARAVAPA